MFHISSYYDKLSVNLLVLRQDLQKKAHLVKGLKGNLWMKEGGKQGHLQKIQLIV